MQIFGNAGVNDLISSLSLEHLIVAFTSIVTGLFTFE